jgi:DNA-binding NarL/FixJ family response regulator
MKRITVLLAEDHMVVGEGIRKLLEAEGDLDAVRGGIIESSVQLMIR